MQELCPELLTSEPGELNSGKAAAAEKHNNHRKQAAGLLHLGRGGCPLRTPFRKTKLSAEEKTVDKNDVCNMQYTSGTTGFPKGVMLYHYNVVNNGKAIGDCMDLSTADRMMIQVPMFHCFGMVLAMTACMTHGTTMSPMPVFSPRKSLCVH